MQCFGGTIIVMSDQSFSKNVIFLLISHLYKHHIILTHELAIFNFDPRGPVYLFLPSSVAVHRLSSVQHQ